MLWMITDFSKTPDIFSAEKSICEAFKYGAGKVSLRNDGFFSFAEIVHLSEAVSTKYPQKEVYLHDIPYEKTSKHKYLHFPSSKIDVAIKIKAENPDKRIALSTHSEQEFLYAFSNGIDYAFYSPVFKPLSKNKDNRKRVAPIKLKNLYLLGGIDRMKGRMLIEKGYLNIAGVSLFYGKDAGENIFELASLIKEK